jgi:hypothetical protein
VTVLPVILTLFNAAGLFYCLHLSAAAGLLASLDSTIQVWSSVLFTFEALTNMYCAGEFLAAVSGLLRANHTAVLIAMRIVRDSMILKSNIGSSVQHILWIIVESAAIYTYAWSHAFHACHLSNKWVQDLYFFYYGRHPCAIARNHRLHGHRPSYRSKPFLESELPRPYVLTRVSHRVC